MGTAAGGCGFGRRVVVGVVVLAMVLDLGVAPVVAAGLSRADGGLAARTGSSGSDESPSAGSCLIGGSATSSGCVVTSQQPVLQIPGTGTGNVYIVDGSSTDQNDAWVSPRITLSPSSGCGGRFCYPVPPEAGLLPRQSYQWTFVSTAQQLREKIYRKALQRLDKVAAKLAAKFGADHRAVVHLGARRKALRDRLTATPLTWQGFTIDYVRAGREPTASFGPLTIGLASGTVQSAVQSQAVTTASGTVQIGLAHRGAYSGTPTGEPWFVEDPAGALPVGWVFTGVDVNVPWVRITAVDAIGGSGTRAVTLQAFDGSLLEFTNTDGGPGGWAPPVGVGRPANRYGSLSQSTDGSTFTWTSGTSVVTFVESSVPTVWLAKTAQVVLPGSDNLSPGLQVSWDAAGRLSTIADQTSLDGNGQATRVARFYYGGDGHNQCASPTEAGLVSAPKGMLCAFENLDKTRANVFYRSLSTDFGAVQIGQVALPGGATWSYDWQVASYTLIDNSTVTAPQLLWVQTPSGHDAVAAQTVAEVDDSQWWVVYDPFFGTLQGIVSPLPGVGAAAKDRLGRFYAIGGGQTPNQAVVSWATVSGSAGSFSLSKGADLQTIGFDSAWRRTSLETHLDAKTSYRVTYTWDDARDVQTGLAFAGAKQIQGYDFLGRQKTVTGPGTASARTGYDQASLAGWIATVYDNGTLSAPGLGSAVINSAGVSRSSPIGGASGSGWSMQLATYLAAPAGGDTVVYRLTNDANSTATLWVNGRCDPLSLTEADDTASCGNTATTSAATAKGDALHLVVQYVRTGKAVSTQAPLTVTVEQQIDGGAWTALSLAGLDPGLNLRSTQQTSDTLTAGGTAVTLTRTTAWDDGLFRTVSSVTDPGLDGNRITVPTYEADYDPTNSLWKRLLTRESPGGSRYGRDYWDNSEQPSDPACANTAGVVQAGRIHRLSYPEADNMGDDGLSRHRTYDAAGRRAGLEVIPAGQQSGVVGCMAYDDRGRNSAARVEAYANSGGMARAWTYSADSLTTTLTDTFEDPPAAPACASEPTAPYTCTTQQTVDLLGRTVAITDVWGTETHIDYQLDATTGVQTTTATTTAGSYSATTTQTSNRDGTPASLSRTDSAGSPTLGATWTYDSFGRPHSVETTSGGSEVITATYGYDDQTRVDSLTWSRGSATVLDNGLSLADNSPRTLGETISVGGVTYDFAYTFNDAGWLTDAQLTTDDKSLAADWRYAFDKASLGSNPDADLNGNVTSTTTTLPGQSAVTLDLGYDFLDRIEATSANTTIAHDGLGNLTRYGNTTLTYDQTNQLITASDGTTTVSFDRTPDGTPYRKTTTSGGTPTSVRYATGNLILDDSGTPTHQTVILGTLIANLDLTTPSATRYWLTTLQGGHALLELDDKGAAQNTAKPVLYSPRGEAIHPPAADPSRPLYGWQATNLLETNLGVVQMGERSYLTKLGRFTSVDPVFTGGPTPYSYAANDPINNIDPNGTQSQTVTDLEAVGIIVGAPVGVFIFVLGVNRLLMRCTSCRLRNRTTARTDTQQSNEDSLSQQSQSTTVESQSPTTQQSQTTDFPQTPKSFVQRPGQTFAKEKNELDTINENEVFEEGSLLSETDESLLLIDGVFQ